MTASLIPDPAAVFGAAVSLCDVETKLAAEHHLNLSKAYNGGDEFMRQCMRVATLFETWACSHVDFEKLNDVWPYLLNDKFGAAALAVMNGPGLLESLTESHCGPIAAQLGLQFT